MTLNEELIQCGQAEEAVGQTSCLFYPLFSLLEKDPIYPSYSARFWAFERFKVNINEFEEAALAAVGSEFGMDLDIVLQNPNNETIKQVLMQFESERSLFAIAGCSYQF